MSVMVRLHFPLIFSLSFLSLSSAPKHPDYAPESPTEISPNGYISISPSQFMPPTAAPPPASSTDPISSSINPNSVLVEPHGTVSTPSPSPKKVVMAVAATTAVFLLIVGIAFAFAFFFCLRIIRRCRRRPKNEINTGCQQEEAAMEAHQDRNSKEGREFAMKKPEEEDEQHGVNSRKIGSNNRIDSEEVTRN